MCFVGNGTAEGTLETPTQVVSPLSSDKWEATIQRYEMVDRRDGLRPGAVVFYGSSSIGGWDVEAAFPAQNVLRRGFGGSQLGDAMHYATRVVAPHQPAAVVVYSGDNDIGAGKSAQQVKVDAQHLAWEILKGSPDTHVLFLSIKPSIKRWKLWPRMAEANRLIEELCGSDPRLHYIDVASGMLDERGEPIAAMFKEDGLHLTPEGYAPWNAKVNAHLAELIPAWAEQMKTATSSAP
jgi:lysophospholipase L1-like esterase